MIGKPLSKVVGKVDDDVSWWRHEIDRGLKRRKEEEGAWEFNERMVHNKPLSGEKWADDDVPINKCASYLRTKRSLLAYHNPRAIFTPRSADGYEPVMVPVIGPDGSPKIDPMAGQPQMRPVVKAKAREALFNGIISQPMFGLQPTMTRLIKSGDVAYGALKVGYRPQFETDPEPDGEQVIPIREDGKLDLSQYARNPVDGSLITDESGERLVDRRAIPTWEDWFLDWTSYRRLILDPDGGCDPFQHRWIAEEYVRPLADVKADKLYKNTEDLKASGDDLFDPDAESGLDIFDESKEFKEKRERVRLIEIYDMVNNKMLVMADGHGKFLMEHKTPAGITENPYSFYRNNEMGTSDEFYQRPLMSDLAPVAQAYNIAWKMLLRAMKHSTRKTLIRKDALDIQDQAKLQSDEDNALVAVGTFGQYGFEGAIKPWVPAPISDTIYANIKNLEMQFYEVAGLPPEAMGTPKSETATQVNSLNQYSGTRIDHDRACLVECLRVAFKKLDDSIDANMTVERAVQLMDTDGQTFTGLLDRDLIAGDFELDIDVEDMAPRNSMAESAQLIQFLSTIGQNADLMSDMALARELANKFGIKNEKAIEALVKRAQKTMMLEEIQLMGAMAPAGAAPGPVPNAPPPTNEADAISQAAAGAQVPAMQRSA